MMDSDFYTASASNINRTVLQGAPQQGPAPRQDASRPEHSPHATSRVTEVCLQPRPLAGVLLSASADGLGEIFPLYIGRNIIGNNPDADIYLSEATVAPNHAVILVRMIDDPASGRPVMQVSLTDYDSDYGTMVGAERVGFDRVPLYGGEVLRVGCGYSFVLYLFDSSYPGLGFNPAFAATDRVRTPRQPSPEVMAEALAAARREVAAQAQYQPVATPPEEVFPDSIGADEEFSFYGRSVKKPETHSRNATVADNMAGNMAAFYSQTPGSDAARTVLNPAEASAGETPGRAPGTVC